MLHECTFRPRLVACQGSATAAPQHRRGSAQCASSSSLEWWAACPPAALAPAVGSACTPFHGFRMEDPIPDPESEVLRLLGYLPAGPAAPCGSGPGSWRHMKGMADTSYTGSVLDRSFTPLLASESSVGLPVCVWKALAPARSPSRLAAEAAPWAAPPRGDTGPPAAASPTAPLAAAAAAVGVASGEGAGEGGWSDREQVSTTGDDTVGRYSSDKSSSACVGPCSTESLLQEAEIFAMLQEWRAALPDNPRT
mmetsp:Transcript_121113/g.387825  ORF Transcript_121113/g.387825 Transcript_121113/m.387825 type:complete len:252 (+) Transcript_121113:474-1229(+)